MGQCLDIGGALGRGLAMTAVLGFLAACSPESRPPETALTVEISHVVAGAPLRLNAGSYRTPAGDEFRVTRLRYYLSNLRLHRKDGQWFVAPSDAKSSLGYYLIDAADPASQRFEIEGVPPGEYDGIEFLAGVDGRRNHSGAQPGTLDPAHGLFWTWKSGYIFFQLEGESPQSPAPEHALIYHLGSTSDKDPARTVYLPLSPHTARVDAQLQPAVHLHVDVAELFRGAHEVRIGQLHTVMGTAAGVALSDNLPGVFRVDHVHNEPRSRAPAS